MMMDKNSLRAPSLADVINHEEESSAAATILHRTKPSPPNPNPIPNEPTPTPTPIPTKINNPGPPARFLKENPDPKPMKLSLEYRLRVDFTVTQVGPPGPVKFASIRQWLFDHVNNLMFGGTWKVNPPSDVKFVPRPGYLPWSIYKHQPDRNPEHRVVADGRIYFRDISSVVKLTKSKQLPVSQVWEVVRKSVSDFKLRIHGSGLYHFDATIPMYAELPDALLYLVARPRVGPLRCLQHPYTLVFKGLPLLWFAHPDPANPLPSLLDFFQGLVSPDSTVRILEISENGKDASNVVVQFENYGECYKVLKRMCSFSLLKVDYYGSKTRADYDIMWKDFIGDDETFLREINAKIMKKWNGV